MRTVDFFSGLGGFSQGAQEAGAEVVLFANHSADAMHWHELNHPGPITVEQDLGEMDMRGLPDHELLIASPCCQGFSPSGRPGQSTAHRVDRDKIRSKRQVARNTSYAVLAAADVARPQNIIVENVTEFQTWHAFGAWCGMLEAHGYTVRTHTINAADYGGAQERARTILTASLGRAIDLAPTWGDSRTIGDCLLADDDERCRWKPLASKSDSMRRRIAKAARKAGSRFTWGNVDSARGRTEEERFATFTTKSIGQLYVIDGDRIRRIEARELARGMSFPDTYRTPSHRTLAGILIGNAIDCNVARGVVEQVLAA